MQCPHCCDQLSSCCTITTCATVRVARDARTTADACTTSGEVYVRYTPPSCLTGADSDALRLPLFLLLHKSHRVRDVVLHERRRDSAETRQRSGNEVSVLMTYRGALHFFAPPQQLARVVAAQVAASPAPAHAAEAALPVVLSSQETEGQPQEASLTLVFASSASSQSSEAPRTPGDALQRDDDRKEERHTNEDEAATAVVVKQEAAQEDDDMLTLQPPLARVKQEEKTDDDEARAEQMRLNAALTASTTDKGDTALAGAATRRVLRLGAPAAPALTPVASPPPPPRPVLPAVPLTPSMALCATHDEQLLEDAHLVPYVLTLCNTPAAHEAGADDDNFVLEGIAFSFDAVHTDVDESGGSQQEQQQQQQQQQLPLVSSGTPQTASTVASLACRHADTTKTTRDGAPSMTAQSESVYALLISATRFTAAAVCPLAGLVLSHQPQTAVLAVTYPDETSVTALQSRSPDLAIEPLTRLPVAASHVRAALLTSPLTHNNDIHEALAPFGDNDTRTDVPEAETPCRADKAALCHGCYVRVRRTMPETGGHVTYYFFRSEARIVTWLHRCLRHVWRLCEAGFACAETRRGRGGGDIAAAKETGSAETTLTVAVTNSSGRLLALQGGVDATRDTIVIATSVLTAAASSRHGGLRVTLRALVTLVSALCTCFLLRHTAGLAEYTCGATGRCATEDDATQGYEEDVRGNLTHALAHAFALTHTVHIATALHTTLRQEGERSTTVMLSAAMQRVLSEEGNSLQAAVQYHASRLQHVQERGVSLGSCRPALLSYYERYALRLHQTLWLLSCPFSRAQLQPPCAAGLRRVWLAMRHLLVTHAKPAMTTPKVMCSSLCALQQRVVFDTGHSIFDLRLMLPHVRPRAALLLHFAGDVDVMVHCVPHSATHALYGDAGSAACAGLDVTLRWSGRRWPLSLVTTDTAPSAVSAPDAHAMAYDTTDDLGGLGCGAVVAVPFVLLLFRVAQRNVADDAAVRLDTALPFSWQLPALSCLRGQAQQVTFAVPHTMSSVSSAGARDTTRAWPSRKRGRTAQDATCAAALVSSAAAAAEAAVGDDASVLCLPLVVHDEAATAPLVMPRLRPAPALREYVARALPGCRRTIATLAAVMRYMAAQSIVAAGYSRAAAGAQHALQVQRRGRWCRTALNELLGSCVVELRAHARHATQRGVARRYGNGRRGGEAAHGGGAAGGAEKMPWALAVMRAALELPALVQAVQTTIESCMTQSTGHAKQDAVCAASEVVVSSVTVQRLLWRVVLEQEVATAAMECLLQDATYAAEHADLTTRLPLHGGTGLAPHVSPEWQEMQQALLCALRVPRGREAGRIAATVTTTRRSIQEMCDALLRDCLYAMNLPSGAGRKTHALALPLELCLLRQSARRQQQQQQQQRRHQQQQEQQAVHATTAEALNLLANYTNLA